MKLLRHFACFVAAVAALGCTGSTTPTSTARGGIPRIIERAKVENELKQIHLYYQNYLIDHNRPPSKLEDLQELMGANSREYKALQEGRYVLNWKAIAAGVPRGASNTALAYEKDADADGDRYVVLGDGSVHRMNQQQFASATKE